LVVTVESVLVVIWHGHGIEMFPERLTQRTRTQTNRQRIPPSAKARLDRSKTSWCYLQHSDGKLETWRELVSRKQLSKGDKLE
jgi:hypothetical protein